MDTKSAPEKMPEPADVRDKFIKKVLKPLLDVHVNIGPSVWRVCYINEGQLRISMRPLFFVIAEDKMLLSPDHPPEWANRVVSREEGMAYIRRAFPQPHEKDRNPDNVTLGVQSGTTMPGSRFKTDITPKKGGGEESGE